MNKITAPQVAKRLLEDMGEALRSYGFKVNKSRRTLSRPVGRFEQTVKLVLSKSEDGVLVDPIISINSLDIEKAYKEACGSVAPYQYAVGASLPDIVKYYDEKMENFSNEKSWYLATNDESLARLSNALVRYVSDYALRYFDDNSSVERVDALLNKSPRDISVHNWLYPMRAQIGLLAAKLVGRGDLPELISIYSEEMDGAVEPYKTNFKKIKKAVELDV